jgi:hypothetical protein
MSQTGLRCDAGIGGEQTMEAPGHVAMVAPRPHGQSGTGLTDATVGPSQVAPGGGATRSAVTADRVASSRGEVTATLGALDSCFVPAGEERAVKTRSGATAAMVVFARTGREGPSR